MARLICFGLGVCATLVVMLNATPMAASKINSEIFVRFGIVSSLPIKLAYLNS